MSTNKKFRIQNGVDITGEVVVGNQLVITAEGKLVLPAITEAVNEAVATDIAALQAQVDAILGTSPEHLDTLQEIVALFQSEDGDISTLITNNSTAITQIQQTLASGVATAAQGALADTAAQQSDLDAVIAQITDGVATAAQGALADGAIQKTNVSTGLVGSTSFAWPTTGRAKFNVNAEQIHAGPGRDPSYLYSYYGHGLNACNSTVYAFAVHKAGTPIKLYNWSDHTLYGEVTMPSPGYASTGFMTMDMTETHLFVCMADTGNNINTIQNGYKLYSFDLSNLGTPVWQHTETTKLGHISGVTDTQVLINEETRISAYTFNHPRYQSGENTALLGFNGSTGATDINVNLAALAVYGSGVHPKKNQRNDNNMKAMIVGNTLFQGHPQAEGQNPVGTAQVGAYHSGEVYSIDITDPSNPVLNWVSGNPNYSNSTSGNESEYDDNYGRHIFLSDNNTKLVVTSYVDNVDSQGGGSAGGHVTILDVSDGSILNSFLELSNTGDPNNDQPQGYLFSDNTFLSGNILIASGNQAGYQVAEATNNVAQFTGAVLFLDIETGDKAYYTGPTTVAEVEELYPNPAGNQTTYYNSSHGFAHKILVEGNKLLVMNLQQNNASGTDMRSSSIIHYSALENFALSADTSVMATKAYVDSGVAGVDLSGYSTTVEMDSAIAAIPATDLTPYSTSTEMTSAIATAKTEAQTYADQVVASTVDAAPAALDTLNELAAALGDDANFASTVTASIATKADDAATTAALATKADDAATTAALATKADDAATTAALDSKADGSVVSGIVDYLNGVEVLPEAPSKFSLLDDPQPQYALNNAANGNFSGFGETIKTYTDYILVSHDDETSGLNQSGSIFIYDRNDMENPVELYDREFTWNRDWGNTFYYSEASKILMVVNDDAGSDAHGSLQFYDLTDLSNITKVYQHAFPTGQGANYKLGAGTGYDEVANKFYASRYGDTGNTPETKVGQLFVYDATNITATPVEINPSDLGLSSNGPQNYSRDMYWGRLLSAGGGYVYVNDLFNRDYTIIDTSDNSLVATIATNYAEAGVVIDDYFAVYNNSDTFTFYNKGTSDIAFSITTPDSGSSRSFTSITSVGNYYAIPRLEGGLHWYDKSDTSTVAFTNVWDNYHVARTYLSYDSITNQLYVTDYFADLDSWKNPTYVRQYDVSELGSAFNAIETAIANIPGVDLSGYSTTAEMNSAIAAIPSTDLSGYSTTAEMNSAITAEVANVVDAAPASLDTLNELAAALGDDANFASTITASIATKATAADLTALEAQITDGVATLAQGALADTAVQPEDLAVLEAKTSGISYDVSSTTIDMESTLDMKNNPIVNVPLPVSDTDVATKAYVDSGVAGVDLSDYSTTAQMDSAIAAIPSTDLTPYSTTVEMGSAIATAKSEAQSYADQVVASTIDAAPASLDTLNELAAALGDDANFASTVTASIATKADDAATTAALASKVGIAEVDVRMEPIKQLAESAIQPEDFGAGIVQGVGVSDWSASQMGSEINVGTSYSLGMESEAIATSDLYYVTATTTNNNSSGNINLLVWDKSVASPAVDGWHKDLSSSLPSDAHNVTHLEMTDEYVFVGFSRNAGSTANGLLAIKISDGTVYRDFKSIVDAAGQGGWSSGGQGHAWKFDIDDKYIAIVDRITSNVVIVVDYTTGQWVRNYTFTGARDFLEVAVDSGKMLVSGYRSNDGKYRVETAELVDVASGSVLHTLTPQHAQQADPNWLGIGWGGTVLLSGDYAVVGSMYGTTSNGYASGKLDVFDVSTGSHIVTLSEGYNTGNNRFAYGLDRGATDLYGSYLVATTSDDKAYVYDLSTSSSDALTVLTLPYKMGARVVVSSTGAVFNEAAGKTPSGSNASVVNVIVSSSTPLVIDTSVFSTKDYVDSGVAATNARTAGISVDSDSQVVLSQNIDMSTKEIKNAWRVQADDLVAGRLDLDNGGTLNARLGTVDFEGSIVNFSSASVGGLGSTINDQVDVHLNKSTANTGEFVKWNGTDYEWTELLSGRLATDQLQVASGGSISITGPGGTFDFQDGIVILSGSDVRVDTPTDAGQAANKEYVDGVVAATVDAAPAALDTLNELAAALGDDANFSATVTNSIATKADDAATTAALATKADDAATTAALDTKADVTTVTALDTLLGKTEVAYYESMYSARALGGASSSSHSASQIGFDGGTSADTLRTSIHSQISSVSGVRRVEFLNNGTVTYGFVSPNDITSSTQYNSSMVRGELLLTTNGSNVGTGDPDAIHTNVYGTQYSTSVPSSQQDGSGVVSPASGHWPSFDTVKVYDSSGVQSEVTYSDYLTGNGFDSTGQPAGSVSFDTSSSTVSGAINELHTELNALFGTQSGDVSGLQSQITAEVARATSAEAVNAANIVSETSARSSADAALESDIVGLQNQVGTIISGSPASLDTLVEIVSAFENADSDLSGVITANGGRLTAAENNITALDTDITAEENARGAGDTALGLRLDSDKTALDTAIATETSSRIAGDSDLSTSISTETATRIAGDASLQSAIDALTSSSNTAISSETTARTSAVSTETAARIAGDASLQSAIDAEVSRATGAESGLQNQISNILSNTDATALNSLAEIVAEFQNADSTLTGAVSDHGLRLTGLEGRTTDDISEGVNNKYYSDDRVKTALSGGLCINDTKLQATGEIAVDEVEAEQSLRVAEAVVSDNTAKLEGQGGSHYRIDIYDVNGTIIND